MPRQKNSPNKSDFVRSQPNDLTAAQVVAKAKEAGLTITSALVYKVRSVEAAKGSKAAKPGRIGRPPKAAKAKAAKAAKAAPAAKGKPNSSDFIRSLPATLTASEVVRQGKASGHSFSPALVYAVRRNAKIKASGGGRKAAKAKAHAAPAAHVAHGSHAENKAAFKKLMVRLGLDTAEELYKEVHAELKAFEENK
jgi:hypothetical protein